jgi:hypothetical protein
MGRNIGSVHNITIWLLRFQFPVTSAQTLSMKTLKGSPKNLSLFMIALWITFKIRMEVISSLQLSWSERQNILSSGKKWTGLSDSGLYSKKLINFRTNLLHLSNTIIINSDRIWNINLLVI